MERDTLEPSADRLVRLWLYSLAALVFVMVLVGGATRLTESGLSITEWRPVAGALPPLSAAEWEAEFEKYRQIPQYRLVNKGMSLEDFKTIYWWEWGHRFLGRLIGLAFAVPFIVFALTGRIRRRHVPPLLILFALGGAQGFVGWFMVQSGLTERVSVSQYRLAFHLTLALIIFSALLWTARRFGPPAPPVASKTPFLLLGLLFVQIFFGALVAGLDAGLTYQTWPLMDGRLIPTTENLFIQEPAWRNVFENHLTVQFIHRMLAYGLFAVAAYHLYETRGAQAPALIFLLVLFQAGLGIGTPFNNVTIPRPA